MDVKVNKDEWAGVSDEDRQKIEQIIDLYFKGTKIVPDKNISTSKELLAKRKSPDFNFESPICNAACGVAEAAAVAACSILPGGPVVIAICVAAAHAAGDYCRSHCKP